MIFVKDSFSTMFSEKHVHSFHSLCKNHIESIQVKNSFIKSNEWKVKIELFDINIGWRQLDWVIHNSLMQ